MGAIVEGNGQRNRIREVRKLKKLTAQQLADAVAARGRIGMHLSNLTKLETHQRKLTDVALNEIAAVLEVDPSELLVAGDAPILVGVPLLPWNAVVPASAGTLPSDESMYADRIAAFASTPRTIAVRVPKTATPMLPPGAIAIVELGINPGSDQPADGWWVGFAGRELTLLHYDGDWTDALREGNPRVRPSAITLFGRVIEYRVSLVNEAADDEEADDEDIYIEEITEQPDEDQLDKFTDRRKK